MSGINCGTYPIKKPAEADTLLEEQTAEYDVLGDSLAQLTLQVNDLVADFDTDIETIDINVDGATTTIAQKPVSDFVETTIVPVLLLTNANAIYYTNFLVTTSRCSYFYNARVNFVAPIVSPINAILWGTYVDGILVSEYYQDFGEFVINDTSSQWNLQSIFFVPSDTDPATCYFTARLIADAPTSVAVRIEVRLSPLSDTFNGP